MQSLSDARRLQQWQQGVASLVARMLQMTPPPQSPDAIPLVLDVSDGSTLAFMAAVELARCSSAGHGVVGRVASLERKPYSALFHHQLAVANSSCLLEDGLVILDEESWGESWVRGSGECPVWDHDDDDDDDNGQEQEEEDGAKKKRMTGPKKMHNYVAAVVCECFFYQLHSLPMQSALSFCYAVNGIKKCVQRSLQICPRQARIMVAPFELADLHVSHGIAGM
jgi:hypothetical protein